MRQKIGALVLAIACGPGCSVLCDGPGCEDSFPAGRLSVLRGVPDLPTSDVWADADARFDGTLEEGSSWTAGASQGRIVIGEPDASRVVRVGDRSGAGAVDPDATWTAPGTAFGTSVLVVPAVDGGEAFDLWVGAPGQDYGKGALYLFRDAHADAGTSGAADVVVSSATPNDRFGTSLHLCADLTGDRLPEVVVTAPWFAAPEDWSVETSEPVPTLSGAVFLLFSEDLAGPGADLRPWELGRTWWGADPGEGAGQAVVCDQDLDGDGLAELVIGAPWYDGSRGRIYVLRSGEAPPASGPLDAAAWRVIDGPEGGEWFGAALETLTLDAEPVLAVGAAGYAEGAGRVHLFRGSALEATVPIPRALFVPPAGRDLPDHFGRWLYTGDLDGDQRDDLIVGAPDFHGEGPNAFDTGHLWVWLGAGSEAWNLRTDADGAERDLGGTEPFQRVGRAVAVVDVDSDGRDDLLVPTRAADPDEP